MKIQKLEPFKSDVTDTRVKRAYHHFEKGFFEKISGALSSHSRTALDQLIDSDDGLPVVQKSEVLYLRHIKQETKGSRKNNVEFEIKKLQRLRALELPKDLFKGFSHNKTVFLCRYLSDEDLRIEINASLNIVERVNGVVDFLFFGKLGEVSTNNTVNQENTILSLQLLQVCMVYINTLIIQEVLKDPAWKSKFTPEDWRALTPLIHAHINPYGLFPLDMSKSLNIERSKTHPPEKDNDLYQNAA